MVGDHLEMFVLRIDRTPVLDGQGCEHVTTRSSAKRRAISDVTSVVRPLKKVIQTEEGGPSFILRQEAADDLKRRFARVQEEGRKP